MVLAMAVAPAAANGDDDNKISTHLIGYRETPLTINSNGGGEFLEEVGESAYQHCSVA
jgi:hypothetical protein